ncbi:MAG: 2-phospho-L-lactate guanylyltransferase [SAR202 cluster bacterium Io17-Chloro-G9]|nr:MAG: 2-phospho-L-lactate guanylyltransferase [SAR202 cluster bacterium Io17-Chloro-G9]
MALGAPKITAIVPMKKLADSKTRLADVLTPQQRAAIVLGMLRQVLTAVQETGIDDVWVIGGDQQIRDISEGMNCLWMDELGKDLNDTLRLAFGRASEQDRSALYLPGDLPFLKASDLHSILNATRRQNNITLAPARRDGGTNGILVPPGILFTPDLGPRSFTRHLAKAAELGISAAFCYSPGLGMDLDAPEDLETYQHIEPGLLDRLMGG